MINWSFFQKNSGHKSAVSALKFDDAGGRLVSGSRVNCIYCVFLLTVSVVTYAIRS